MSRRRRRLRPTSRRARPRLANHEECETKFLISLPINPAALDALTDEEKAAIGGGHGTFIAALKKSGELITTQALVDPSQAAVVSDGPFLESKEYGCRQEPCRQPRTSVIVLARPGSRR